MGLSSWIVLFSLMFGVVQANLLREDVGPGFKQDAFAFVDSPQ